MITNRSILSQIYGSNMDDVIEKIDNKISEEKQKEKVDNIKILKLQEMKIMQDMFSNVFGAQNKYTTPW